MSLINGDDICFLLDVFARDNQYQSLYIEAAIKGEKAEKSWRELMPISRKTMDKLDFEKPEFIKINVTIKKVKNNFHLSLSIDPIISSWIKKSMEIMEIPYPEHFSTKHGIIGFMPLSIKKQLIGQLLNSFNLNLDNIQVEYTEIKETIENWVETMKKMQASFHYNIQKTTSHKYNDMSFC